MRSKQDILREKILGWYATGETGISSETMALKAAGISYERWGGGRHPCDPDDLRRCVLLVEKVPEIRSQFNKIARLSPQWKAVIRNWDVLEDSLRTEMKEGKSAPLTYEMMNKMGL